MKNVILFCVCLFLTACVSKRSESYCMLRSKLQHSDSTVDVLVSEVQTLRRAKDSLSVALVVESARNMAVVKITTTYDSALPVDSVTGKPPVKSVEEYRSEESETYGAALSMLRVRYDNDITTLRDSVRSLSLACDSLIIRNDVSVIKSKSPPYLLIFFVFLAVLAVCFIVRYRFR